MNTGHNNAHISFSIFLLLLIFTTGCGLISKKNPFFSCHYKLSELLMLHSPGVNVNLENDSIYIAKDQNLLKRQSGGLYIFDKDRNLRTYSFIKNDSNFTYQEKFDADGKLIRRIGSPFVETQIWTNRSDSILFNVTIFSLNRKYDMISVITDTKDTIQPELLYDSEKYTNSKVFPFKLPNVKAESITLYFECKFKEICSNNTVTILDTLPIRIGR